MAASDPGHAPALNDREQQVLNRFVDAWQRCDIAALAAVLREDVILRMPPEPDILGRDRVEHFFATVPADGRLDQIRLVATSANRQPALAAYLPDRGERCPGYGIMVFTIVDDAIVEIVGFPDPELFDRFGLPADRSALPLNLLTAAKPVEAAKRVANDRGHGFHPKS